LRFLDFDIGTRQSQETTEKVIHVYDLSI